MFEGLIYKAISPSSKIYYGMTLKGLEDRKHKHYLNMLNGSKLYFHNALRKYGINNFIWEIIEIHKNNNKKKLINLLYEKEIFWIDKDKTYIQKNGYNISKGGTGSDIFNNLSDNRKVEVRKIISDGVKKKWKDESYRSNMIKIRNEEKYTQNRKKLAKKQWENKNIRDKSLKSFSEKIWNNIDRNKKISESLKNRPKEKCIYCGLETNNASCLKRWHNENCKKKSKKSIKS